MNTNLSFDFSVDKENKTIRITREFAADIALVWDAYTRSEILDKWWAPRPWKARTKEMDFRNGGKWHYAMVGPEGEEHWAIAEFSDIVPLKVYKGKDAFADAEGNINTQMPQSTWEVAFEEIGDHTLVQFYITYPDLAQLEATIQMGFKEGIAMAMEGLDEWLANAQ